MAAITAFCTFGLRSIVLELAEPFQAATGHTIDLQLDSTPGVKARIRAGEPADLVLVARSIAEDLAGEGHLSRASIYDVTHSGIGVAIRQGAPRPDIGTTEAFKQMLLASRCVVYTDPASGGASGVHFATVIDRLGIADAMRSRTRLNVGTYNAELVARGEADIAIQQIAEILPVAGVELLGPLPADLQLSTVFVAAIGNTARHPAAAHALVELFRSRAAAPVIERHGMTPA